ncbi:hypothetical protein OC844_006927 [Tilletia horrida]|nr:hypothetical protein OC844_006927 [Tilletia horrida]
MALRATTSRVASSAAAAVAAARSFRLAACGSPSPATPVVCRSTFTSPRRQLTRSARAAASTVSSAPTPAPWDPAPALDPATRQVPSAPYDDAPLPGTAPHYHTFLVIHPASRPRPNTSWPPVIGSVSPLVAELEGRTRDGASLEGFGLAFSDGFGDAPLVGGQASDQVTLSDWDPNTSKFMRPLPSSPQEAELFDLYIYTAAGKQARLGGISLANLDDGEPFAHKIKTAIEQAAPAHARASSSSHELPETHIYVCTHGMRDCRCGVAGAQLQEALRAEITEHEQECAAAAHGGRPARQVRVAGISHIGGHKWAANAIVHTDWYGNLRTSDAKLLLRAALAPPTAAHDPSDSRERLVHWPRWRGRIGMTDLEQQEHYAQWGPERIWSVGKNFKPKERGSASANASAAAATVASPSEAQLGDSASGASRPSDGPLQLRFRASATKEWYTITDAQLGETLKDVAKRHGLPSIEATCGGQCECATCHAYMVSPAQESTQAGAGDAAPDLDAEPPEDVFPEKSEAEDDMLDYAIDRRASSRLTCQVKVTRELADWMQHTGGWIELPRF